MIFGRNLLHFLGLPILTFSSQSKQNTTNKISLKISPVCQVPSRSYSAWCGHQKRALIHFRVARLAGVKFTRNKGTIRYSPPTEKTTHLHQLPLDGIYMIYVSFWEGNMLSFSVGHSENQGLTLRGPKLEKIIQMATNTFFFS